MADIFDWVQFDADPNKDTDLPDLNRFYLIRLDWIKGDLGGGSCNEHVPETTTTKIDYRFVYVWLALQGPTKG